MSCVHVHSQNPSSSPATCQGQTTKRSRRETPVHAVQGLISSAEIVEHDISVSDQTRAERPISASPSGVPPALDAPGAVYMPQ